MPRPQNGEFAPYFQRYIDYVKADSLSEAIANYEDDIHSFYNQLPDEKANYFYDEGKWTVKELLQHVIDAERVFSYRVLWIARKDTAPLPSFDEKNFAKNSFANTRTLNSLKEEFNAEHKSTLLLLKSFNEEQLQQKGIAGEKEISVNALGFIIYGHLLHHKKVLLEKYLL
ncbi:MAG: DinB family protein [Chitinophagaceae bacterium]